MSQQSIPEGMKDQCKPHMVIKGLVVGRVPVGMVVWALHRIRIFVPPVLSEDSPILKDSMKAIEHLDQATRDGKLTSYDVDGQLFDDYFAPIVPTVVVETEA